MRHILPPMRSSSQSSETFLDENLSPQHAAELRTEGHDAVAVFEVGLSGATDEQVLRFAVENGRVLVTLDADFANVIRFPPAQTLGVVRLKVHPATEVKSVRQFDERCSTFRTSTEPGGWPSWMRTKSASGTSEAFEAHAGLLPTSRPGLPAAYAATRAPSSSWPRERCAFQRGVFVHEIYERPGLSADRLEDFWHGLSQNGGSFDAAHVAGDHYESPDPRGLQGLQFEGTVTNSFVFGEDDPLPSGDSREPSCVLGVLGEVIVMQFRRISGGSKSVRHITGS